MKDTEKTRAQLIAELEALHRQVAELETAKAACREAEDALRASEERMRGLAEASFEAIFLSEAGICIDQNNTASRMFGYTMEEAIGKHGTEWIAPEDRAMVRHHMMSDYREPYEATALRKDGTTFPVEIRGRTMQYKGRAIRVTALHDISARKQAEEALREAELSYRTVADFTYDWEYWVGPDGELLYTSPACERITGYTVAQFFERPQLLHTLIIPEDRETVARHRHSREADPDPREIQFRIRRSDGTLRWIEHVCQPVTDAQGHHLGYRASNRDISTRKQTEETLRKFSLAVEQSANIIVITDTECNIEYVNPRFTQTTGYTLDEVRGQNMRILKSGLTPPETYAELQRMLNTQGEWHGKFRNRKKDGTLYWESTAISPIRDTAGKITHYLAIKEDITERKQAEDLQRIQRDIGITLSSTPDMREAIEHLLENILKIEGIDSGCVYVVDPDTGGIDLVAHEKLPPEFVARAAHFDADARQTRMVMAGECIYCNHGKVMPDTKACQAENLRGVAIVPVKHEGRVVASLNLVSHTYDHLPSNTCHALETIAAQIGGAMAHKQAERQRLAHLRYLQNMDRIDRIIVQTADLEQMVADAIKEIRAIFKSDRAWLLYPCAPDASYWRVPVEDTDPDYPGAFALGEEFPMTPGIAEALQTSLDAEGPVVFGPGNPHPLPPTSNEEFGVRSQMTIVLHPKIGAAWLLGLHQCTRARVWTAEEQRLFRDIGHRISDTLSNRLFFQNLQESEAKFRSLVEQSHDGVVLINEQGCIVEWNQSQEQITGLTRDEVFGERAWDVFPRLLPTERATGQVCARIKAGIQNALHNPVPGTRRLMEQEFQRPDGERRTLQLTIFPIKAGEDIFISSTARDITARKQAEEALKKHVERINLLYEAGKQLAQTLDLGTIYDSIYSILSDVMDCSALFVSSYDPNAELIYCEAAWQEGKRIDVSDFPPLPLEPEGYGTQSRVIRSGEALYLADYVAYLETAHTTYHVKNGKIGVEVEPDEEVTHSALIAPIKLEGRVVGVIQTFSYEYDAYTEDDMRFFQALTPQVAAATANALLYRQAQQEIAERKRAEEALRASESKLRSIIEHSNNLFFSHTPDHVLTYMSPQTRAILDCEPEEAMVRWTEFITDHPVNKAGYEHTQRAIDTGERQPPYLLELIGKKGHKVWVEISESPVVENGKTVAIVGAATDITARRQAEEALRASEEHYKNFFENALVGIFRSRLSDGMFIEMNSEAARQIGLSVEEIVGKLSSFDLYRDIDQRKELVATLERDGEAHGFEIDLALQDGREVTFSLSVKAYPDEDYMEGVVIDVTERKRAEAELHASEQLLRSVFENMQEGFFRTNLEGEIIWASPSAARMVGYNRPEEVIGFNITNFYYHPDERQRLIARLREAERISDYEVEARRLDGSTFIVSINAAFYRDESGAVAGIEGSIRDITARKCAEERAWEFAIEQERSNVLQRFIGDASHDLKTPLTTIKTSLYILSSPKVTKSMRKRHLETLASQAARLEKLLEDMLSMSRLDEEINLKYKPTDLNTLMQNMVTRYTLAAKQKGHTIEFDPQANLPIVLADGVHLYKAIGAVITNAINYTADGGTIIIRTAAQPQTQQVIIEIQDNGMGIGVIDLPHIFKRFYRADKARNSDKGGAGLGLALAKKIIEAHQGYIEVESTIDEGSTFRIFLPIVNTDNL